MYVCISITELVVFIFIQFILPFVRKNCPVANLLSYFFQFFLHHLTFIFMGSLMELMAYDVLMLQGLRSVGLH